MLTYLIISDSVAVVESVKAASDVMSPVSGTVTAVNELLINKPDQINAGAESNGMFVYKLFGKILNMSNNKKKLKNVTHLNVRMYCVNLNLNSSEA